MIRLDHGQKMSNDVVGTDVNVWANIDSDENQVAFRGLLEIYKTTL